MVHVTRQSISEFQIFPRITKYRRRSTSANKSDAVKYKQSICGTIDYVYKWVYAKHFVSKHFVGIMPESAFVLNNSLSSRFSTMCDYQYLPIKRDDSGELLSMLPYLCVESLHRDKDNFTREAPLFVPPPTFSRLDTPQDYLYRDAVHVYKWLLLCHSTIMNNMIYNVFLWNILDWIAKEDEIGFQKFFIFNGVLLNKTLKLLDRGYHVWLLGLAVVAW